jgi:hypothetical protein
MVAAEALPALMPNMVMGALVNRNYEATLAQAGDTVNIPIPPVLQRNNIAEGGSVQLQNPSFGNAQVVLNFHQECTIQIPDVTRVLAYPQMMADLVKPQMIALAGGIDTDLLSEYVNLTANAQVGTGDTPPTESTVDSAETALSQAYVPDNLPKYGVVSPTAYSALRQIERFTEARMIGTGDAIIDGRLNLPIKGINFFRSQLVPVVDDTTYNVVFARDAFALVMRRLPKPLPGTGAIAEYATMGGYELRVTFSYQPNTLAQQVTVDCLYGLAVLRNVYGVVMLS